MQSFKQIKTKSFIILFLIILSIFAVNLKIQVVNALDETNIQDLINALPIGRNYIATADINGNYTCDGTIYIPSYTRLDLMDAYIECDFTLNCQIFHDGEAILFTNDNHNNGNVHIEIIGGKINTVSQTGDIRVEYVINLINVDYVKVERGLYFAVGINGDNIIQFSDCNYVTFKDNTLEKITTCNFLGDSHYLDIGYNFFNSLYDSPIEVGSTGGHNVSIQCTVSGCPHENEWLNLSGGTFAPTVKYFNVHNNIIMGGAQVVGFGIDLFGNVEEGIVQGNFIHGTDMDGIICIDEWGLNISYKFQVKNVLIQGNEIKDPYRNGIVHQGEQQVIIMGNSIRYAWTDGSSAGIVFDNYDVIMNNQIISCSIGIVGQDAASWSIINNNLVESCLDEDGAIKESRTSEDHGNFNSFFKNSLVWNNDNSIIVRGANSLKIDNIEGP